MSRLVTLTLTLIVLAGLAWFSINDQDDFKEPVAINVMEPATLANDRDLDAPSYEQPSKKVVAAPNQPDPDTRRQPQGESKNTDDAEAFNRTYPRHPDIRQIPDIRPKEVNVLEYLAEHDVSELAVTELASISMMIWTCGFTTVNADEFAQTELDLYNESQRLLPNDPLRDSCDGVTPELVDEATQWILDIARTGDMNAILALSYAPIPGTTDIYAEGGSDALNRIDWAEIDTSIIAETEELLHHSFLRGNVLAGLIMSNRYAAGSPLRDADRIRSHAYIIAAARGAGQYKWMSMARRNEDEMFYWELEQAEAIADEWAAQLRSLPTIHSTGD